jgi:hypothetical protein
LIQLVNKGFLRRITRGLYEIIPDAIQRYLRSTVKVILKRRSKKVNREMNQSPSGTSPRDRGLNAMRGRGLYANVGWGLDGVWGLDVFVGGVQGLCAGGGGCVGGLGVVGGGFGSVFLFLDNVRGVSVSGVYRGGDRGSIVSPWLVSDVFERIDYGEFGVFVADYSFIGFPGVVAVYPGYIIGQGYGLKIEFRPYGWFNKNVLRNNGSNSVNIALGFRYMWRILLSVFLVLGRVLLSDAPLEIRRIVSSWIRRRCRG